MVTWIKFKSIKSREDLIMFYSNNLSSPNIEIRFFQIRNIFPIKLSDQVV